MKARERFYFFILNEETNNIIKIIKSSEDSGVLIDGITETIKHEKKNHNVDLLGICWHF